MTGDHLAIESIILRAGKVIIACAGSNQCRSDVAEVEVHNFSKVGDRTPGTIDLRSDTVTRPTDAMYERMMVAPLGDDGQDGDPTVQELEELTARLMGKPAGLFVPSCTMANLIATLAQIERGQQIVIEAESHMYVAEPGIAMFSGGIYVPIVGTSGEMDVDRLASMLRGGLHRARSGLVTMETTHNNAGGTALGLDHMATVSSLARSCGIPVHIDGARLFNAATFLGVEPAELAAFADTVSICLSKGLSAPMGAVLIGEQQLINRARGLRRALGGQQRQAGVAAAAGIVAVTEMRRRLNEDHLRAAALSTLLNRVHPTLSASDPQTNIVLLDVFRTGSSAEQWVSALSVEGLLVRAWGTDRLRLITHRHISDNDIADAAAAVHRAAESLIKDQIV